MKAKVETIVKRLSWEKVDKIRAEGKDNIIGCILAAYKAGVERGLKEGGKVKDGLDV